MSPRKKSEEYNATNKRDFIKGMSERMSMPYEVAKFAYDAFWDELEERLLSESPVVLSGRGTFTFAERLGVFSQTTKDFYEGREKEHTGSFYTLKFSPAKRWRQDMREEMRRRKQEN